MTICKIEECSNEVMRHDDRCMTHYYMIECAIWGSD